MEDLKKNDDNLDDNIKEQKDVLISLVSRIENANTINAKDTESWKYLEKYKDTNNSESSGIIKRLLNWF